MMAPEIKRILSELVHHKKSLVVVAGTGLLVSIAQNLNIFLIKHLLDSLEGKYASFWTNTFFTADMSNPLNFPLRIAGCMILLAIVGGAARYFHLYRMNYTAELTIQSFRSQLQRKFMNLNLSFHNNFTSGSGGLISRILNDMSVVQNGLRMFADFFREPLTLVAMIAHLFWLNTQLTLWVLIGLPVILIFLKQISRTIKTFSIKGQTDLERITSTIKESLDGVRIIQSFNLEDEMAKRFRREGDEYLFSRKKIHQRVELSGPVSEVLVTLIVLTIVVYLAYLIAKKEATYGDFVAYIASLLALSPPIKKLQESYVRIQETMVSAKRVFEILDNSKEVPQEQATQDFPKSWSSIEYKNVSFSYGNNLVLKNLDLKIKKGEVVAFVGASGSGKSTIVNLLERFFDPTSGQILIDQIPIQNIFLKDLRKNVALVTQDVFLFSDTIENNIRSGDYSKSPSLVPAAAKAANAEGFILKSALGYQTTVGDRGNLLSGGEKQRVSIARAIFKDAPILILDEATSALDSVAEAEVQKGLDKLMEGRTTLVIAHRLSTVMNASRIIVMRNGEIVAEGTHKDLLAKSQDYRHLYDIQFATPATT